MKAKPRTKLPKRASAQALSIPGGGGRGARLAAAGFNPNVTVKIQDVAAIDIAADGADGADGNGSSSTSEQNAAGNDDGFASIAAAVVGATAPAAPAANAQAMSVVAAKTASTASKGDSDALLAFSSRQAALAQAANRPKSAGGTRRYSTAQEEEEAESAAAVGAGRIRVFVRLRPVEEPEMAR